jgi:hypothetical protein
VQLLHKLHTYELRSRAVPPLAVQGSAPATPDASQGWSVAGNPLYLSGASGSSAAHSSGIDQTGAARSASLVDTYPTPRRLDFAVAEAEEGNQPRAEEGSAPQACAVQMQGMSMEDQMGAMSLGTPGSGRPVVKWVGTGGIPYLDHKAMALVVVAELKARHRSASSQLEKVGSLIEARTPGMEAHLLVVAKLRPL